ncbi:MAG TPA: DUF2239 family protein [Burkholderiales bacterium]|jgi:hypothetical protein|nr:DUF2239 family protein [Burkholderiales bacterium]
MHTETPTYTAFLGNRRLATGTLPEVATRAKQEHEIGSAALLVFADADASAVELDLRGSLDEVLARLPHVDSEYPLETAEEEAAEAPRGPGRPKLGVVAREVTLLPRHWDWLGRQTGGASVVLRKLVEAARKQSADLDRVREAREATYRFTVAMAGNQPGFEEATRALFAGDGPAFTEHSVSWPLDLRDYAYQLAGPAFD